MKRSLVIAIAATLVLMALAGLALAGNLRTPPPAGPSGPTDRVTVPAPIDELDVLVRESAPPQVSLRVMAGLPSGCAQRHSHKVERSGTTIAVTVLNSMPKGDVMCTMIYGTYSLTIDLGSDFVAGTSYTVRVNDKDTTFKL